MDSSVIVVGNGSSVLDSENGELINSFDIIVRFNEYKILGFEKYVGTKTDYWFNTVNFVDKKTQFRMYEKYKRIVLHSWEWDENKDKLYTSFKEFYKNENVDLWKTKRETILEIQEYVKDGSYASYSTGAIAIWMLLKEHDKILITGFDWWEVGRKHHYSDNVPIGKLHKPEKEYQFIKSLQNEGKVGKL